MAVAVVVEDVFFLYFDCSLRLTCFPFSVNKVLVLLLQKLICVRGFGELLVDEPVLPSQRLDILSQLSDLLLLQLCQLLLTFSLLHVPLAF